MQATSIKDFNEVVKATTNNLNSRPNKPKVDRRAIEQALAPAISNGKSHASFVADLKNMPKTATGVALQNSELLHDFSICHKVQDISNALEQVCNYDFDKKSFIGKLIGSVKARLSSNDTYPEIIDILSKLTHGFTTDGGASISISGVNEPCANEYAFTSDYEAVFNLQTNAISILLEFVFDKNDDGDIEDVSISSINIDGEDYETKAWGTLNKKDEEDAIYINAIVCEFEETFHEITKSLLELGVRDISCDIPHISPQLMSMLIEELKPVPVKSSPEKPVKIFKAGDLSKLNTDPSTKLDKHLFSEYFEVFTKESEELVDVTPTISHLFSELSTKLNSHDFVEIDVEGYSFPTINSEDLVQRIVSYKLSVQHLTLSFKIAYNNNDVEVDSMHLNGCCVREWASANYDKNYGDLANEMEQVIIDLSSFMLGKGVRDFSYSSEKQT